MKPGSDFEPGFLLSILTRRRRPPEIVGSLRKHIFHSGSNWIRLYPDLGKIWGKIFRPFLSFFKFKKILISASRLQLHKLIRLISEGYRRLLSPSEGLVGGYCRVRRISWKNWPQNWPQEYSEFEPQFLLSNEKIGALPFSPRFSSSLNETLAIGAWPALGYRIPRQIILFICTQKLTVISFNYPVHSRNKRVTIVITK